MMICGQIVINGALERETRKRVGEVEQKEEEAQQGRNYRQSFILSITAWEVWGVIDTVEFILPQGGHLGFHTSPLPRGWLCAVLGRGEGHQLSCTYFWPSVHPALGYPAAHRQFFEEVGWPVRLGAECAGAGEWAHRSNKGDPGNPGMSATVVFARLKINNPKASNCMGLK